MSDMGTDAAKAYVLITPAYNESKFIEQAINSVLAQTILPLKWVIVDDGSTDSTAAIVKRYARDNVFIEYHSRQRRTDQTYYESNVYAILEGYEKVRCVNSQYLAILDADMVLCSNYYEEMFGRFEANQDIGIATGVYFEDVGGVLKEAIIDRQSTPKALQVFRRTCYEQIGGYLPCRHGGEDTCMEIMARMHGWQTWSFRDIKAVHLRPVGTGDGRGILRARFRQGLTDYCLATQPVFMLAKCLRRCLIERPYALSGMARLAGFLYGYIVRTQRQIPDDARRFVRREQLRRLLAQTGLGSRIWNPVQYNSKSQ